MLLVNSGLLPSFGIEAHEVKINDATIRLDIGNNLNMSVSFLIILSLNKVIDGLS